MKKLTLFITLAFLTGCAGVQLQSVDVPVVQEIAYKDIVACKKVDDMPSFSDCKIKLGDTGGFITVRIQTANIPEE